MRGAYRPGRLSVTIPLPGGRTRRRPGRTTTDCLAAGRFACLSRNGIRDFIAVADQPDPLVSLGTSAFKRIDDDAEITRVAPKDALRMELESRDRERAVLDRLHHAVV